MHYQNRTHKILLSKARALIVTTITALTIILCAAAEGSWCDCMDMDVKESVDISVLCNELVNQDLCMCHVPKEANVGGYMVKLDTTETNRTLLIALCDKKEDCSSGCMCGAGKTLEVGLLCTDNKGDGRLTGEITPIPTSTCIFVDPSFDDVSSAGVVNYKVDSANLDQKFCTHDFLGRDGYINGFIPNAITIPSGKDATAYKACSGGPPTRLTPGHTYTCLPGQTMTISLNGSTWNPTDIGNLQGTVTQTSVPQGWFPWVAGSAIGICGTVATGFATYLICKCCHRARVSLKGLGVPLLEGATHNGLV